MPIRQLIRILAAVPGAIVGFAEPIHATPTSKQLAELETSLEAIRRDEGVAAFGFAVTTEKRTLIARNRGWSDLAAERPVTPSTRFRVGSITKTFTGVGLLTLVESGELDLDAPVATYVTPPPFDNRYRDEAPVRVAHLMEHTAGFSDISREEFAFNEPFTPLVEVLARFRANHRTRWKPGLHSSYTNLGPGIAGLVLEAASGESFENYMTARVLTPLGMTSSTWHLDGETAAELATGYNTDGETPIPYWHMAYRPFGALNTTPADMARFIRMLLNRGRGPQERILDAASVDRLETPKTTLAARAGLEYGYGLGSYQWFRSGLKFHGHGGDGDGYLAHYGYAPGAGLGYFVVITAFKGKSLRRMRRELEEFVVAHASPQEPPPPARTNASLRRWIGSYVAVTARFGQPKETLQIRLGEEGLLETRRGSRAWRPLLPAGPNRFRRPDQPEATVAILPAPEGDIIYQGDEGNFAKRKVDPAVKSKEGPPEDDY